MMAWTSPERTVRSIPLRISLPATPARRPLISSTWSAIDDHLDLAVDDVGLVDGHGRVAGSDCGSPSTSENALPCFQHSRALSSQRTSPSDREMSWWLQRSPMA